LIDWAKIFLLSISILLRAIFLRPEKTEELTAFLDFSTDLVSNISKFFD
jgi:hypothetical protein